MRKLISIFSILLFLDTGLMLFGQTDPLQEKIAGLKSVASLPDFISQSYFFENSAGKISMAYPVFSKEQEKEYKIKNSSLAKQAEKAEFDKQKEEWKKKAQAQKKAWEEFQKIPYLFNFNTKLAGAKFIHPEGSLTFLNETEIKYREGEWYYSTPSESLYLVK